jgi:hypothetical protein
MKVETITLSDGHQVIIVWQTKKRYVRITKDSVEIKKRRK